MKKFRTMAIWLLLGAAAARAQTALVTHAELQATTTNGASAWADSFPFAIRGVIVNDPEEMLDPAFNPSATTPSTGGQFQMFIQAAADGDRGGTALYMAQRSFLGDHYDEATWSNEMRRVTFDGAGRKFRKGDLVEVVARKALFYGGKRNVNEAHRTTASNDFDVVLVKANVGLPQAEALTLADLVDTNGVQIFDATRALGGEHWQGQRVRLDGIRLTNTNGWGQTNWSDRICTVADGAGRSFTLRLPRTDLGEPPATTTVFSATGILNQESESSTSGTNGYELFVQEIGPELSIGRSAAGGVAVSFSSDYAGYVLQASDDGLESWLDVDVTPRMVVVVEDAGAATNRTYRLIKKDE
ncbi:MAG TPA: hypothetical protein PK388_00900 [Kiritimatiellia bacterium]|nr:hypothetical protein [Kiritimatiellia bacterium]